MLVSRRAKARLHLPMGRLPRLRRFSGGRARTGSLVALVVLFPAATLAMSGLNRDRQGEARAAAPSSAARSPSTPEGPQGIFKLDHLIFIVQENRSFDHYFGTYPGADGFEMAGGQPTNCVPDAVLGGESCVYHTSMDVFNGGPHSRPAALTDINGGAMNGFIDALPPTPRWCVDRAASECDGFLGPEGQPDVMSYLTRQEIPN
jgi:phospholipase C